MREPQEMPDAARFFLDAKYTYNKEDNIMLLTMERVHTPRVALKKGKKALGYVDERVEASVAEGLGLKAEQNSLQERLDALAVEIVRQMQKHPHGADYPYRLLHEDGLGHVQLKLIKAKPPELVVTDPFPIWQKYGRNPEFFDLFLPTDWRIVDIARAMELLGDEFYTICAPAGLELTESGREFVENEPGDGLTECIKERPGREASVRLEWHAGERIKALKAAEKKSPKKP